MSYTFRLNDVESEELSQRANLEGYSLPDYIRFVLFPDTVTSVNVTTAIKRALAKQVGDEFTVPSLFKQSEYAGINRGHAGSVGREFNNEIVRSYRNEIDYIGVRNRQALYRRK